MAPIRTKAESYALLRGGHFGPKLRNWRTLADLLNDPYDGPVGIRSWQVGFPTIFHVPQCEVVDYLAFLEERGQPQELFYFGEMAPDEHIILQGEFADGVRRGALVNRHLWYSTVKAPMKPALAARPRFAEGSAAEAILRGAMNENSWEDFQVLREQHPDSSIEFSCYDICLGDRPHRNCLFWEIRTDY